MWPGFAASPLTTLAAAAGLPAAAAVVRPPLSRYTGSWLVSGVLGLALVMPAAAEVKPAVQATKSEQTVGAGAWLILVEHFLL
jgi:hypothetical protein